MRGRSAHRRRLALLALLAAAPGNRLSRERILSFLWPDRDSESGRKQLSEALHVIRKELGDDAIIAVADDVRLNIEVVGSDLLDFRNALAADEPSRAVSAYDGPFLDGWYVSDAREFDEWADRERQAIAAEYARALERTAEAEASAGDLAGAAERYRALVTLRPDAAHPVLRLSQLLAMRGDRAGAIRALSSHQRWMASEELPVEPEVLTAEASLRAGSGRMSPVQESVVAPTDSVADARAPAADPPRMPQSTSAERPRASRRSRVAVLALGGLIGLSALAGTVLRSAPAPSAFTATTPPNQIAVLYLQHDPSDSLGYLADGITENLIDELSTVPALRIVSRTGVLHYRSHPSPPPMDSIARALRASWLVEGRVERIRGGGSAPDRVRVSVSLIDAATGAISAPPRTAERALSDAVVFSIRRDVASSLAVQIRSRLGRDVRLLAPRSGTAQNRAQVLFDRAAFARNTAWALVRHGRATDLAAATRALASADSLLILAEAADASWIEPTVARGWVARERARLSSGPDVLRWLRRAVALGESALSRAAESPHALELRGTARWLVAANTWGPQHVRDSAMLAADDLRHALRLDSSLVVGASHLAQLLRIVASSDADRRDAIRWATLAYQHDPFLARAEGAISQLYRASLELGMSDSAEVWCSLGHEYAPQDPQFVECPLTIMRLDLRRADFARARAIVRELDQLDPPARAARSGRPYSPYYRELVAAAIAASQGRPDSARGMHARAIDAMASDVELLLDAKHEEILLRLALGERAQAFAALREYLKHRPDFSGTVLSDRAYRQFGLDSAALARAVAGATGSR